MAKITVTLTASYDDGATTMLPGDTVKIEEKEAVRLADLGMVVLPDKNPKVQTVKKTAKQDSKAKNDKAPAKESKQNPPKDTKGQDAQVAGEQSPVADDRASPESIDGDPFTVDPDGMDLDALDPDAMGDEEGV